MASEKELTEAVKEALQKDGHLGKFQAELRAAVIKVLERKPPDHLRPKLTDENLFVNEIIREYLDFNGFRYTAQMLAAETGSMQRLSRRQMAYELGVCDDSRTIQVPLLYSLVTTFQKNFATRNQ